MRHAIATVCRLIHPSLFVAFMTAAALPVTAQSTNEDFEPLVLPGRKTVVTNTTDEFLTPPENLAGGDFTIAKTPPTIDFLFYPGQTYPGNPWSGWGDTCAVGDTWYSAIGDHYWNCFIYEYDAPTRSIRQVLDMKRLLDMPEGHYTPAKVHTRIDMGSDGRLYFATHRGSSKYTTDEYHFEGDWIISYDPSSGEAEVISHGPVGKESIPVSVLDPQRMIFYGGTQQNQIFFAYDIRNRKLLYQSEPGEGPYRYMMLSSTTGRVYFVKEDYAPLRRYDPSTNELTTVEGVSIGMRSSTRETPQGYIYACATRRDGRIYRFDVRTEKAEVIGNVALSGPSEKTADYVATLDADPTGRYLYFNAGSAHGGSDKWGAPVVQFDVTTGTKKVLAFLYPFYEENYQYAPDGVFGSSVSPDGSKLYITMNGYRTDVKYERKSENRYCAVVVVHIPESER